MDFDFFKLLSQRTYIQQNIHIIAIIKNIVETVAPAATDESCEPELPPERNIMKLKIEFIIPNISQSPDGLLLEGL